MCTAPVIATVNAERAKDGREGRFELHSCGALIVRFTGGGGGLWASISNWSAGNPAGHVATLIGTEGWRVAAR